MIFRHSLSDGPSSSSSSSSSSFNHDHDHHHYHHPDYFCHHRPTNIITSSVPFQPSLTFHLPHPFQQNAIKKHQPNQALPSDNAIAWLAAHLLDGALERSNQSGAFILPEVIWLVSRFQGSPCLLQNFLLA